MKANHFRSLKLTRQHQLRALGCHVRLEPSERHDVEVECLVGIERTQLKREQDLGGVDRHLEIGRQDTDDGHLLYRRRRTLEAQRASNDPRIGAVAPDPQPMADERHARRPRTSSSGAKSRPTATRTPSTRRKLASTTPHLTRSGCSSARSHGRVTMAVTDWNGAGVVSHTCT
jgi:hypothetical protein